MKNKSRKCFMVMINKSQLNEGNRVKSQKWLSLTITAEQTHLCVFTFPAPEPVLAPSFHCQSRVFCLQKDLKIKRETGRVVPSTHVH